MIIDKCLVKVERPTKFLFSISCVPVVLPVPLLHLGIVSVAGFSLVSSVMGNSLSTIWLRIGMSRFHESLIHILGFFHAVHFGSGTTEEQEGNGPLDLRRQGL